MCVCMIFPLSSHFSSHGYTGWFHEMNNVISMSETMVCRYLYWVTALIPLIYQCVAGKHGSCNFSLLRNLHMDYHKCVQWCVFWPSANLGWLIFHTYTSLQTFTLSCMLTLIIYINVPLKLSLSYILHNEILSPYPCNFPFYYSAVFTWTVSLLCYKYRHDLSIWIKPRYKKITENLIVDFLRII